MGRQKHPICEKCKQITEFVGNFNGNKIYGCKTPQKCGYKEYQLPTQQKVKEVKK